MNYKMLLQSTVKVNTATKTIDSINVQSSCVSDAQNPALFTSNDNWQDIAIDSIIDSVANIYNVLKNYFLAFLHKLSVMPKRAVSWV